MTTKNYIIFTISFLLSFVNFMIFYSYPFLLEEIGVTNSISISGVVVGIATILTLLMRIISGVIIDRFSIPWAISITALFYTVALLLLNINHYETIIIGRISIGILLGIMSTLLMYYSIIKSESAENKSSNIALITFFSVLPTCIAPFISLKIKQFWGVDTVIFLCLILFIFCLFLAFILDTKSQAIKKIYLEKKAPVTTDWKLSTIFKKSDSLCAIVILALIYIISGTTVTFLPTYLIKSGLKDPSWYFLIFTIFMILPRILLKKYMPKDNNFPSTFLTICISFAIIGTLSNFLFADNYLVILGAIFCGFALGLIYPTIMSYIVCCFDDDLAGTSSSIVASSADLGVIFSNIGLGFINMYLNDKIAMILPIITSCIALILLISRITIKNIKRNEKLV